MNKSQSLYKSDNQRGAVLIVGMIMLVIITLMVTSAFTLSNTNAKSVGNMQFRSEAIASASKAIEQTIGSWDFISTLPENDISVDIDSDGTNDYVVTIAAPTCVSATGVTAVSDPGDGQATLNLDGTISPPVVTTVSNYNVLWDIQASVKSVSTGAQAQIHQGVSRSLTQDQCNAACPLAGAACS